MKRVAAGAIGLSVRARSSTCRPLYKSLVSPKKVPCTHEGLPHICQCRQKRRPMPLTDCEPSSNTARVNGMRKKIFRKPGSTAGPPSLPGYVGLRKHQESAVYGFSGWSRKEASLTGVLPVPLGFFFRLSSGDQRRWGLSQCLERPLAVVGFLDRCWLRACDQVAAVKLWIHTSRILCALAALRDGREGRSSEQTAAHQLGKGRLSPAPIGEIFGGSAVCLGVPLQWQGDWLERVLVLECRNLGLDDARRPLVRFHSLCPGPDFTRSRREETATDGRHVLASAVCLVRLMLACVWGRAPRPCLPHSCRPSKRKTRVSRTLPGLDPPSV